MDIQEQMTRVQKIAGLLAGKTRKVKLKDLVRPEDLYLAGVYMRENGIIAERGHFAWQRWHPDFRKAQDVLQKMGLLL